MSFLFIVCFQRFFSSSLVLNNLIMMYRGCSFLQVSCPWSSLSLCMYGFIVLIEFENCHHYFFSIFLSLPPLFQGFKLHIFYHCIYISPFEGVPYSLMLFLFSFSSFSFVIMSMTMCTSFFLCGV